MKKNFQQPEDWGFIRDLQKEQPIYINWKKPELQTEPQLICEFSDPESLLETAVESLRKFMREAIPFPCPVTIRMLKRKWKTESYELETARSSATVSACDPEGLRRGIYHLIQLWKSSQKPHLPKQKIRRTPWLKNRISRCFFSPINRPPANRDELLDDVDYYPEPYLDRLAAAGINGLWVSAELNQIAISSFTGEPDKNVLKRIEKLQQTVDKCRRYGIRIFLQMNEPLARPFNDPLYQKYPDMRGVEIYGRGTFCPSSPEGQAYLEETCRNIFSSVKHLGGLLNITYGESITTCASADHMKCPRCSKVEWKEILHQTWRAMRKGMDAAAPEADLICWLYIPAPEILDEKFFTLLENPPERVIVQLNCESGSLVKQNGKEYRIGDYWLSTDTPSENFIRFAETAKKHNVQLSAKLQVGCSHEVATVPYVPVPGILYRKYRHLKKLNVTTVMQCWYFGNYPGLMNQAAGELAFETFEDTEEDFLERLARQEWGKYAPKAAAAWKLFSNAYVNYPATNMFQYFGPVADGISWPLHTRNQDLGLTPTWLLEPEENGDNIFECLMEMSLKDAIVQMKKLSSLWHKGQMKYNALRKYFTGNQERILDIDLGNALDIQFNSALNILQFYHLRNQMTSIREKEISNTLRMIELTKKDNRLGFHSEAEGYKYYPEKLEWRLKQLRADNNGNGNESYQIGSGWLNMENFRWKIDRLSNGRLELNVELDGFLPGMDELSFSLDDSGATFPALFHADYRGQIYRKPDFAECSVTVGQNGWKLNVLFDPDDYSENRPLRFNLLRLTDMYKTRYSWPAKIKHQPPRLNLIFYQSSNMGTLEE